MISFVIKWPICKKYHKAIWWCLIMHLFDQSWWKKLMSTCWTAVGDAIHNPGNKHAERWSFHAIQSMNRIDFIDTTIYWYWNSRYFHVWNCNMEQKARSSYLPYLNLADSWTKFHKPDSATSNQCNIISQFHKWKCIAAVSLYYQWLLS